MAYLPTTELPGSPLTDPVGRYIRRAKAPATVKAYSIDWMDFTAWCDLRGYSSLPAAPIVVAEYISALAARAAKASTIQRRLTAISKAHQVTGKESPTRNSVVRETWAGIRRVHGVAREGKKALLTPDIWRLVSSLPDSLAGRRDRAIILLGFAGAFRRSELVNLDVSDMEEREQGLRITVRRSKTDQDGHGQQVGIVFGTHIGTCPVRAFKEWLRYSRINEGPIFRSVNRHDQVGEKRLSDKAVALIIKRAVTIAGLDPSAYAGHSLRAGHVTVAAQAGVSEHTIMKQTRHKSLSSLRIYIREGSLFRNNSSGELGL